MAKSNGAKSNGEAGPVGTAAPANGSGTDRGNAESFKEEVEYALGALASASRRLEAGGIEPGAVGAGPKALGRYLERARESLVDVLAVLDADARFFDPWKYGTKVNGQIARFAEIYGDRAYFVQGPNGVGYFQTDGEFRVIEFDEADGGGARGEAGDAEPRDVFAIELPGRDEKKG